MKNMNNKSIVYGLGILAILAPILTVSVITLPMKAIAAYGSTVSYNVVDNRPTYNPVPSVDSISPDSANIGEGSKTVTISGDGFVPSSVARINGLSRPTTFIDPSHLLIHLNASDMVGSKGRYINVFNPTPGGGYSNSAFFTLNGSTAPTTNSSNGSNSYTNNNIPSEADQVENQTSSNSSANPNNNLSGLAANAIFGTDSFMPSGLVQWIMIAIFILLMIILVRKMFGAQRNYHSEPLKHA